MRLAILEHSFHVTFSGMCVEKQNKEKRRASWRKSAERQGQSYDQHSEHLQGPDRTQCHRWTGALAGDNLGLLKSDVLQMEDGATQLSKLIRLRPGKDLQQDVLDLCKRFLHHPALYTQSMQHHIASEKPRPRKSLPMCFVDFFC